MCTLDHNYRDFKCPECGALVTCLSCIEIHAAQLPKGPAFTDSQLQQPPPQPEFETIGTTNDFELIEPPLTSVPLLTNVQSLQPSLFV